jgi:Glu-tRNA(Gln) amidotransferase subunit E-like FAD-binding protein
MSETRRGRKSQASYRDLIAKALFSSRFDLESFPVLSQLPAVESWAEQHIHELLPHGKALQSLLRRAIEDVIQQLSDNPDVKSTRVIEYLRYRFFQQKTVKAIAAEWQCSVVHVWRVAGHEALDLITDRFLRMARSTSSS